MTKHTDTIVALVRQTGADVAITSTVRNTNDWHGRGYAVDASRVAKPAEMQKVADFFFTLAPYLKELIYSGGPGPNRLVKNGKVVSDAYYGPRTLRDHRNHVHIAGDAAQLARFIVTSGNANTAIPNLIPNFGLDYSHYRPSLATLRTLRPGFVCRYFLPTYGESGQRLNQGKSITRAEADWLNNAGIYIVANYEYEANAAKGGRAAGVRDAKRYLSALKEYNIPVPANRPCYFSCADYDIPSSDKQKMLNYLDGASSVLGKSNVGLYGGYNAISWAAEAGYKWLWQTYAWSQKRWHPKASIRQTRIEVPAPGGDTYDTNTSMVTDYGQWTLREDFPMDQPTFNRMLMNVPIPGYNDANGSWNEGGFTVANLFSWLREFVQPTTSTVAAKSPAQLNLLRARYAVPKHLISHYPKASNVKEGFAPELGDLLYGIHVNAVNAGSNSADSLTVLREVSEQLATLNQNIVALADAVKSIAK